MLVAGSAERAERRKQLDWRSGDHPERRIESENLATAGTSIAAVRDATAQAAIVQLDMQSLA
ncbi:MAG: hypothetical protein ACLP9L_31525 [Thermoguttaceae bacterium]